jgi:3-hydroxybutyryl-CoA dehydrogenase
MIGSSPADTTVAVVGLGLMGRSIAACLAAAGHEVVGYDEEADRCAGAPEAVESMLAELETEGILAGPVAAAADRFQIADTLKSLQPADLAIEAITEDAAAKQRVFAALEGVMRPNAVIASNTSAIPITLLQSTMERPGRLVGVHWAEPAHLTRFLEIIAGDRTDPAIGQALRTLAEAWGKEPTLVKRDVRGFVANRIMYAMIREAFHLVEAGIANVEDVDRSVRNDIGCWATLAGPFRWMDLTGIPAYAAVMRELMPDLSNATEVPRLMQAVVDTGAQGTANAKGFYDYTDETARAWDDAFRRFSIEIRRVQQNYPDPPG